MKNSLLLLAGAAALSLASCSQTSTTDTTATGTPAADSGTMATTTTQRTMTDADYHMRGDRMAMKFASANKITDEAMMGKLKSAYYERSKRYDMMMNKYQADTAGMSAARQQYMMDTDKDFQGVLTDQTQYKAYQSSMGDYDEASNMDMTDQGAASGSMDNGSGSMDNGSMSNGSSTDMSASGSEMSSGAAVEKSKSKMSDGSKMKMKEDGTVKMKDGDGNKTKM